jgi:hypothetical protein
MHTLMACLHQTEPEHRVLAANLLLQLDMLVFLLSHIIFFFRNGAALASASIDAHGLYLNFIQQSQ